MPLYKLALPSSNRSELINAFAVASNAGGTSNRFGLTLRGRPSSSFILIRAVRASPYDAAAASWDAADSFLVPLLLTPDLPTG